jgi:hypothetical protein
MHPSFPLSARKALCCLVLCLLPAGFSPCPATAAGNASGQLLAASEDSLEAERGLSAPDGEGAGEASSFWEQFFGGSYTGAVLFGYPAHGPGLPDLLLGCAAGVLLLRAFRSRRQPPERKKPRFTPEDLRGDYRLSRDSPPDAPSREQPGQGEDRNSGGRNWSKYLEAPNERERQEMQQRARTIWEALRSQPESPASPEAEKAAAPSPGTAPGPSAPSDSVARGLAVPADFDLEDFLDGARMLYARLQTSWAARDLEDLTPFATPEMMDLLRRQAEQDPTPGSVEVLLVTAVLTGLSRREEEERVEVAFSAILQENPTELNQDEKISVNETWQFVRGPATGGGWRLAGIRQTP